MYPTTTIALLAAMLAYSVVSPDRSAHSQGLTPGTDTLNTIADFADRICVRIPLEGSTSSIEASGSIKAELPALLAKLLDLGLQGAAKYQESKYQGLLQQDLVMALQHSRDCKKDISLSLMSKLLEASTARIPVSIREDLSRFVIEGQNLKTQWLVRISQGADQRLNAEDVLKWDKHVEDYLANPPLGLIYVARFKNKQRGNGSYPDRINLNVGGIWDLLHSDLDRLDEFIKER